MGTNQELSFGDGKLAANGRLGYWPEMLSVLIETENDDEGLARTLVSLVAAAVEGVVREVIVCDRGSTDHTHAVAEQAGCRYLADAGIAAGVKAARCEWLLLLEPGARLLDGWTEAAASHAMASTGPACFTRSRHSRLPLLARLFSPKRPLALGLMITKRQALARTATDAAGIARSVSARRLSVEILVAPAR